MKAHEEAPEAASQVGDRIARQVSEQQAAAPLVGSERFSPGLDRRTIVYLQRAAGNVAVAGLIERSLDDPGALIAQRDDEDDGEDREVSATKDVKAYGVGKAKDYLKKKVDKVVLGKDEDDGEKKEGEENDPGDAVDQVLADMKSSADKSKQWIEYIYKGTEYYQKYKMRVPISWWPPYLDPALRDFDKMLGVLKPGFDTAAKFLEKAQKLKTLYNEGRNWLGAFETFVGQTNRLDGTNPMSVHAWVTAMQGLEQASLPMYKEMLNHLADLGLEGTPAAAEAFLVLAYVGVELGAGEHLLELGIEDIEFEQRRIRAYEAGALPVQAPPEAPPFPPLPWMSQAQHRQVEADWRRDEKDEAVEKAKMAAFYKQLKAGYVAHRPEFVAQIDKQLEEARSQDPSPSNPQTANPMYWKNECLTDNGDVDAEIENFETASGWGGGTRLVPYPGFDELYETTWARTIGGSAH